MNLIIADETLADFRGHSFEYARSLSATAESWGHPSVTLARTTVVPEVARKLAVIPCFSYDVGHMFHLPIGFALFGPRRYRRWRARWNQQRHGVKMLADLKRVESRLELNAQTLVIAPTVFWHHVVPLVRWAEHLPPRRRPRFALVFHTSAYPDFTDRDDLESTYRSAFRRLERSPARSDFHLFTDSEELIDEFQSYTNLPFHLVPIPHSGGESETPPAGEPRAAHSPVRIAYLGDAARPTKGFQFCAPLCERLRRYFESGRLVAEFQASFERDPSRPELAARVRRLKDTPGVTLHEEPLNTAAYYGLLERADIVVLPYTTTTYHSQTSGVFSEAAAHAKPMIVPRGTWMARQLAENAAGLTFIPADVQSLYDSVVEAIDRCDELSEHARGRAAKWRSRHSVPAYLNTVFHTVGAA